MRQLLHVVWVPVVYLAVAILQWMKKIKNLHWQVKNIMKEITSLWMVRQVIFMMVRFRLLMLRLLVSLVVLWHGQINIES